jgi:hypothetical protein
MKATEVPQENAAHYEGHLRACYALDEHGRYTVVPSNGWDAETIVNSQAVAEIRQGIEDTRRRALAGRASALEYHMCRRQMTPAMLAAESGIWIWRVRRHLKPKVFAALKPALLERYAWTLRVSVDELVRVPENPQA